MEFTKNMQKVMERAVRLAREERHRYFMPEHLLYGLTFDEGFCREYEAGGGDVKKLREDILGFVREQAGAMSDDGDVRLTADMEKTLYLAECQAASSSRAAVDISHFLAAVLQLEDCYGLYFLARQDVDLIEVMGELSRESLAEERDQGSAAEEENFFDEEEMSEKLWDLDEEEEEDYKESAGGDSRSRRWQNFVEDMNQTCRHQNPLIGRNEELERTIQILCRKDKNNVLHIGEPGVGKTALAYGLAQRIEDGRVPEQLSQARIYGLDLGGCWQELSTGEILKSGLRGL